MSASKIVRIALVSALTVLPLSACGDDNKASTLPTRTATPTPTVDPTDPAGIKASAEQFVRQYYSDFNTAQSTGNVSLVSRHYDTSCRECQHNVDVLEEDRRKGQHVEDYASVIEALTVGQMEGNTLAVRLRLHDEAGRVVRSRDGAVLEELPASKPVNTDLILARFDAEWRIIDIVQLGEAK